MTTNVRKKDENSFPITLKHVYVELRNAGGYNGVLVISNILGVNAPPFCTALKDSAFAKKFVFTNLQDYATD